MKRAERDQRRRQTKRERYRGRRPRSGLTAGQVIVVAILVVFAMVGMGLYVGHELTGASAWDQLYYALFVLEDWS